MTLMAWIGLAAAWMSVGAIALQTARGGRVLPAISVSDETRAAGRRALRRALLFATIYTAILVAADLFLPAVHAMTAEVVVRMLMFAACPVIVFWAGSPLMRRGPNPVAQAAPAAPSKRVASLVVRDEREIIPPAWWIAPALLFAAPFVALFVRRPTGEAGAAFVVTMAMSASFAVGWGVWAASCASARRTSPAARDPEALDRACMAFRRFMARGIFIALTGCVLVCSSIAILAVALDGNPQAGMILGIAGGVGGSAVGVAGAILGVLADRRRRGILELGGVPPEPWTGGRPAHRHAETSQRPGA